MMYLLYLHFSGAESLLCDFNNEVSCDIVNHSRFSEILGIPVALLGMIYFISLLPIIFSKKLEKFNRIIFLFTLFSLVYSLFLSVMEFAVIGAVCVMCETSKIVMLAILLTSYMAVKERREELRFSWVFMAFSVGLLFSSLAYAIGSQTTQITDENRAVAQCLSEKGIVLYATKFCPSCVQQK